MVLVISISSYLSKLCFQDRKKVHYTFDDGTEMVEEYDAKTNLLLSMMKKFLY